MAAAMLTTPLLGFQLRGTVLRHRVAATSVQMQQLATEGDLELPVPAAFLEGHKHNLKDIDEYKAMYQRSVEDPSGFWADIANTFHWETPFTETVRANSHTWPVAFGLGDRQTLTPKPCPHQLALALAPTRSIAARTRACNLRR